jgi:hypothetical protein
LFLNNSFNLQNGTLFSFDYNGVINGLTDIVQFDPGDGSNLFPNPIDLKSFDGSGVTFNQVPIPSAILLLGGGLIGLVGLRRRKSS